MRTYHLDAAAKAPLYEQLYRAIRQDIMDGSLAGGERLPSKRRLAEHLKVSSITVEAAYGQLLAEGYVVSKPRSGYFVQAMERYPAPVTLPEAEDMPVEAPQTDTVRYDFQTNTVDTACFPFATWARLLRGELTTRASQLLAAAPPQGAPELRQEICRYLAEFRGIRTSPEQVVVGAGSEYLLSLIIQLLGRERVYSIENPGYPKLERIFRANGAPVAPLALDAQGLRVDLLRRSDASVVYLTPSHHFPLGVVMPAARRRDVLQWAIDSQDRYIIEDDYDSEFRYASRPIPAMKELDHADRVIYLNTFAKSLAPSLRIGYMVLPRRLLDAYHSKLGFYASTVPSFEQYTLAQFLHTGSFERHVSRIRNLYKGRRDVLLAALQRSTLGPHIRIRGAEAGLHILLTLNGKWSEAQMVLRAYEQGVRVSGLSEYYSAEPASCPESTVILGYAGLPEMELEEAVTALERAWS
ncbi:MAG: PLP-dependent aminotransferase family protein [Butyricicoccus sp.]|nr:PLP-dependent aminotransferase family protein [Butyricicoccus sp.]